MNGTIFMSVTDYNGRTIIQGPGSRSHLSINKGQIKKVSGTLNKSQGPAQSFLPVDAGSISLTNYTKLWKLSNLTLTFMIITSTLQCFKLPLHFSS